MKSLVSITAIVASLAAGTAFAADLPSQKAPPPPASLSWTGFYAGLNAGYGWGTNSNSSGWGAGSSGGSSMQASGGWSNYTYTAGTYSLNGANSWSANAIGGTQSQMTQSGFIGGAQIGYNHQWKNNLLLGFEADIQGSSIRGGSSAMGYFNGASSSTNASGSASGSGVLATTAGIDYLGTVRGRVGYVWSPSLLLYGTAGLAYGGAWANVGLNGALNSVSANNGASTPPGVTQSFAATTRQNSLLVGYSAGGGAEWMFMPNWSLKAEALYYNLGNMNISSATIATGGWGQVNSGGYQTYASPAAIASSTKVNYQGVIARAGINYHFNFASAPVVAKF
jgi:outer membrane immunogenic protein